MVNVVQPVWQVAETEPERVALRSAGAVVTYGELRQSAQAWAGALAATGLGPADKVLLIAPSVPEFAPVAFGVHTLGAALITMNVMATAAEIGYVLDDSKAALVVAWQANAEAATAAANERGLPFWVLEPGATPPVTGIPVTTVHDHAADDVALLLYTSGTTGRPKGAELTASNLLEATRCFVPVLNLTSDDRFGMALPLFHVYGQAVIMNTVLATGASLSLLSPFDAVKMLEMVRSDQLTALAGVPTMWNAMLHAAGDFGPDDFTSLRLAVSGAAALPADVIRAFKERFGATILEGYGLTESTGAATFNDLNREQKLGTVGPPLPNCAVEIRDPEGNVLAPGKVGEIFLKGPIIMRGYHGRPEASAETLRDGWLASGDLGHVDADGYLTVVDRTKDLIIRGGYNVYPREVEEVLYEHPDIMEVAVVGVPDEHLGELVAAVVALRPGAQGDAEALRAWAKVQLSGYKVPKIWQFVDALPKGPTGKILKRAIDKASLAQLTGAGA